MAKFLELEEAAKLLGVTPDELVEMRSNGQIRGFRDGASWKFKEDEIERAAAELGLSKADVTDDAGKEGKPGSSVLVSEEELGDSSEGASSTVIGRGEGQADEGSDLKLAPTSSKDLASHAAQLESDVTLVPGAGADSDVSLVPDPGTDREMVAPSDSEMDLQPGSTGGTGRLEMEDSDLTIGSDDLDVSLDSELALSDDDDVMLGSSGTSSDLVLGTEDSGINLTSPSDSGLSLEADSGINLQTPTDSGLSLEDEPLELADSSVSSLELPEDEEVVDLEDQPVAPAGQEEFNLEPSEDMFGEESDSGSQVIALDESDAFEAVPAELEPAAEEPAPALDQMAVSPGAVPAAMPYGVGEAPQAPYSVWNLLGLFLIILFLSLSGIILTDVVQNMWAWDQGRDVSTALTDGITTMIFGK